MGNGEWGIEVEGRRGPQGSAVLAVSGEEQLPLAMTNRPVGRSVVDLKPKT
ncbi:MAG: hypothetical protein SVX43_03660 [Cyanobacteriota bacterium]|nr:hypothetical protein [Cyanobacteriota bacterium]